MGAAAKRTILLVEDEVIIATFQKVELENCGYAVLLAHSGEQALAVVEQHAEVELILMDIDLGRKMDGTEAARQILLRRELPILFLSSHTEAEIVNRTEQITSYGYVVKDSGITVLDRSIKMAFKLFEANQHVKESEEKFRLVTETIQDVFWMDTCDLSRIIYVSPAFTKLWGIPAERLYENPLLFLERIYADDRTAYEEILAAYHSTGRPYQCTYRLVSADGSIRWIQERGFPVPQQINGKNIMTGICTDITRQKSLEDSLQRNEEFLNKVGEMARVGGWEVDLKKKTVFWTRATKMIHEVPLDYEPTLEEAVRYFPGDSFRKINEAVDAAINAGTNYELELEFETARKKRLFVHTMGFSHFENGKCIRLYGTFQDITEQKRQQDQLATHLQKAEELNFIVNHSPAVAFLWKNAPGWPVEFVSENIAIFGYSREELLSGRVSFLALLHPEDLERVNAEVEEFSAQQRDEFKQEYRLVGKNGEVHDIEDKTWVRRDEKGAITHYQGILWEITEHKQAGRRLAALLSENKTLLHELQHRAKNSFMLISSMLMLAANNCRTAGQKELVQDLRTRVNAISEMYSLLYQTDSITEIDLADYLRRLLDTVPLPAQRLHLHCTLAHVKLSVKKAICLGIIVTELVTNAVKHAFPGESTGTISLGLERQDAKIVLQVSDDGVGLPDGATQKSLGLQLVRDFSLSLEGSFQIRSDGGTRCRLEFMP